MKVVLASGNRGKLAEFNRLFGKTSIQVVGQSEYGVPEAEETGLTFVENAILKARNACHHSGQPAISDDSGIEVAALQGAPGIYSARYAGQQASGDEHIAKLLEAMRDVPAERRQARFYCVLVYMRHEDDPTPIIAEGFCAGEVMTEPKGDRGFGYDPILYLPEKGGTVAELLPDEKNRISHRARAFTKLLPKLVAEIAEIPS